MVVNRWGEPKSDVDKSASSNEKSVVDYILVKERDEGKLEYIFVVLC